jgi:hypothetical protein
MLTKIGVLMAWMSTIALPIPAVSSGVYTNDSVHVPLIHNQGNFQISWFLSILRLKTLVCFLSHTWIILYMYIEDSPIYSLKLMAFTDKRSLFGGLLLHVSAQRSLYLQGDLYSEVVCNIGLTVYNLLTGKLNNSTVL